MPERRGSYLFLLAGLLAAGCLAGIWLSSPTLLIPLLAVVALLTLRLFVHGCRHARLARALEFGSVPGTHAGVLVRWRRFRSGAVVAGVRRPTIYCDPDLRRSLSTAELRAVVLHERCHQLRRDPARLLVLAALEPFLRLLRPGRAWLEWRRARLEIDADGFALRHGVERADLARAILRLGGAEPALNSAGFASAVELRLKALVGDIHDSSTNGRRRLAATIAGATLSCALAVLHHLLTVSGGVGCVLVGC